MIEELYEIQIDRENTAREEGIKRYIKQTTNAIKQDRFNETPYGMTLLRLGYDVYKAKLDEYFELPLKGHSLKQRKLLELICDDTEVLAYLVITMVLNSISRNMNTLTGISMGIMTRLFNVFLHNKLSEDNPKLKAYLGYEFRRANKKKKEELIKKNIQNLYDITDYKTESQKLQLGTILIDLLEKSGANIIELKIERIGLKTINAVGFTEEAVEVIESIDPKIWAENVVSYKPLVVPPKDWTGLYDGGHLVLPNKLIKVKHSGAIKSFIETSDVSKIVPIINKFQKTPWRINKNILPLIKDIFYNNLEIGKLPRSDSRSINDILSKPTDMTKEEWARWNYKRQIIQIELDKEFGNRLSIVFALSVAEELVEFNNFYYVYHFDYRGRIYPDDSHFNFMKVKAIKSMIEFGEGEYLTPDGLWWLKVHIANTYGLDKQPYNERVAWVDNNYALIQEIVVDPLAARSLWQDADSPLEFVAACYAYNDHLSGDKVHLPIQLDATCSGIQMYSGLLRDEEGAVSVNVVGSTRNDIYQRVADTAEAMLLQNDYDPIVSYTDSEGEVHTVLTDATANSLRGHITRQLVKRPTMTVPYGVTKRGMQEQIYDELKNLKESGKQFWEGEDWVANRILTDLINRAIFKVVHGARIGQDYLVNLSRTLDKPAIWYSPLYQFPIHQNALKPNRHKVSTIYGELIIHLEGDKLNKSKQANQIAPNFIHSIDATVLANVIDNSTFNIGTIHDCFLVPPNSGYDVQELYKEAFVRVMEEDPLRLIQQQLDPEETVPFPEYGELQLDEVYNAQYIIS